MFTSKHYDFQKLLFGEIVFDEEYNKTKKKTPAYICMYTYIKFVCVFVCLCVCVRARALCVYVYTYIP